MLTVIVAAEDDAVALARTLATLVPAAVAGVVSRVLVVTSGPASEEVAALIEASGADYLAGEGGSEALWVAGLARARPGWRLCLVAGATPLEPWIEAIARHMASSTRPAAFALAGGWAKRVVAGAARLAGRASPVAGLLTRDTALPRARLVRLVARIENPR